LPFILKTQPLVCWALPQNLFPAKVGSPGNLIES
jgi:hypothetical protein